jgi:hypothetical protein
MSATYECDRFAREILRFHFIAPQSVPHPCRFRFPRLFHSSGALSTSPSQSFGLNSLGFAAAHRVRFALSDGPLPNCRRHSDFVSAAIAVERALTFDLDLASVIAPTPSSSPGRRGPLPPPFPRAISNVSPAPSTTESPVRRPNSPRDSGVFRLQFLSHGPFPPGCSAADRHVASLNEALLAAPPEKNQRQFVFELHLSAEEDRWMEK